MEEEARVILRAVVADRQAAVRGLGTAIHRRFRSIRGVNLALPPREPMREPPTLR